MTFEEKLLNHLEITKDDYNYLSRNITVEDLPTYQCFKGIDNILKRLQSAIAKKEKVIVYGDYDCDGIMATSILVKAFAMIGLDVKYYIPSRYQDGYGLNVKNVEAIAKKGYDLIITVDNGISALEAVTKARELGMDVIVTDHHEQIMADLPDTPYIMHPIISNYGDVYCCGAYVSYMLATALLGRHDDYLLSLASLATVSDMMELKKYNRDILRLGIDYINNNKFIQIYSLVKNKEDPIDENTIGSEIAPKINAIGRMKEDVPSMQRIVRYFITNNSNDLNELLLWIEETNNARKELVKVTSDSLIVDTSDSAIVAYIPHAKEGLIGLIANKLMQENNKPTIVLTESLEDDNLLKGSARSKAGFSISDSFSKLSEYLVVYGGHELAGGLSINKDKLDIFKEKFNEIAKANPFVEQKINTIDIELLDLSKDNYRIYEKLKPFGMGFERPSFKIEGINTSILNYMSNDKHISTMITNNVRLIGFFMAKNEISQYYKIDVIGYLENTFFKAKETINFKIFKIANS